MSGPRRSRPQPLRWTLLTVSILGLAAGGCGKKAAGGSLPDGAADDGSVVGFDGTVANDAGPDGGNAVCGNGQIEAGEECDDANGSVDDYCLNDCTLACGDGVVNAIENCDVGIPAGQPGACPTVCDDNDACTQDSLVGTSCDATCVHGQIGLFVDGDGCCPPGGNANNDSDCTAVCGNGVVEGTETCDGNCVTTCDDGNVCTTNTANGSAATCDLTCTTVAITSCIHGDGCCAPGCNANSDDDCNSICGNDIVEPGEICDGNCPLTCVDGVACTADATSGSAASCNLTCSNPQITNCIHGDGCCAPGCDANNDDDCLPDCGNNIVEPGETCDGNCPLTCFDGVACTTDATSGSAATCDLVCSNTPIATCGGGDNCCPSNCNSTNDSDCSVSCNNGVVEAGETCDPPSSCPTTCVDSDACTADSMSGSAANCNVVCTNAPITSCIHGDGCCAPGCNTNNDDDCPPDCGNNIVEPPETCDGNCAATCFDGVACTADATSGSAATCDLVCTNTLITTCTGGDGCCAQGCNANTDSDCNPFCGNNVVEPGETCDGNCPADCDDTDNCTTDTPSGSAAGCDFACANTPITTCTNGDLCCAPGCNSLNDSDCPPVCGNSLVEAGEQCDDGNTANGDGCSDTCQNQPIVFRVDDAWLRDPHVFLDLGFFGGCQDGTNGQVAGNDGVNLQLNNAIDNDGDGDTYLDLSLVLIYRPLDQSSPGSGSVEFAQALCTDTVPRQCDYDPNNPAQSTTYDNDATNPCLTAIAGTTWPGYTPALVEPTAPCFATGSISLTLNIAGTPLTLSDGNIGATYSGNPATSFIDGLVYGFVSETDADNTDIDLGLLGTLPLSDLLQPNACDCCGSNPDDRDQDANGVTGWYFYINFVATRELWIGP